MGGDYAPDQIVLGACQAVDELPIQITLLGPEDIVREKLKQYGYDNHNRLIVYNAPDVVEMGESPTTSFRRKKNSSIRLGLYLLKEGKVDGYLSAGNTGAVLTASTLVLGKIENIERPAVATVLPTTSGKVVMLDMGTNVDCRPSHLEQFAIMGNYFAKLVLGIDNPRVGLLNIGEEPDKGNKLSQSAFVLLKELPINFLGNIEGKDVLTGKVDVIVTDGFVGNTLLKFGEGVYSLFKNFFKSEYKSSLISKIGLLFLAKAMKRFQQRFDYAEVGGAPLLGVNGISFISHGKSNARAIKQAIRAVYQAADKKMIEKISKAVAG